MKKLFFCCIILLSLISCNSKYKKLNDGIIVSFKQTNADNLQLIRLQVISENIIHVCATADNKLSSDSSLMSLVKTGISTNWNVSEVNDTLTLSTKTLKVRLSLNSGELRFLDSTGTPILMELKNGGKTFVPNNVEGKSLWKIRQVFDSPQNEAFYGLGQHQNGIMDFKGQDVDLYQYNSMVAIPFVVSNKNYGILWDKYSLSKFGDNRDYQPLSNLNLFDENGNSGGITAIYRSISDSNKIFIKQVETNIDYEFITSLKKLPATFPMNQGEVIWKGSISSDTSGVHKFRLYSAGYAKVWVDGKLIVDRWRQSWNPSTSLFTINMEKGKKYAIKIYWNPDGGESYIGLHCLKPLPDNEQNQLTLYSEAASQINYYFIKGNNIDSVISGYRQITGKAPIMPKWAMGFWQSRERYKTQDEILNTVAEYRQRQIPLDNIVLDWQYWPENKWGDHNFDSSRFRNPVEMIKILHDKYNVHFMISVWPKFYVGTNNYNLFNQKGWLYLKNIQDKQKDWVGPGYISTFYDAYNPDARRLFWKLMSEKLYSKGVDGWWLDASEPDIHSNCSIADRKALTNPNALGTSTEYFNAYPFMNAKAVYDGQIAENPDKRVFILTRSAFAGQQRFSAATWSGDIAARWDEMKTQISAGLNFCISGIPYWTMDIGGFAVEHKYDNPQGENLNEWREQMTRWYEFGAFCPIFRSHGQFPYREIYNIAPETDPVYKAILGFDKLRYRLMPYIYTIAGMAFQNNYTIMRALVMDFEKDTNVLKINDEFMFGPSILVCPVTEYKARSRNVYLPQGNGWYNLFTGKYFNGGQTIVADAPINQIPLFIPEGSIIPVGPVVQYAMQKFDEPIKLFIYTGKDGKSEIYEDEGTNNNYIKGKYSVIPLNYSEMNKTLTIGEREGKFDGMKNIEKFELVWIDKMNNTSVNLNSDIPYAEVVNYSGKAIEIKMK